MRIQCLMFMLLIAASTAVTQASYLLMSQQCLMFMLLLAASTAVTQELYLDEKTMSHVYVIVSCIYGSYTRVIS